MMRIENKMILGLLVVAAMTVSLLITPVSAAQVTITDESFERVFEADPNNHTYVYAEPTLFDLVTENYVEPEDDMDYTYYTNGNSGWDRMTGTWSYPGMSDVNWHNHNAMTTDGVWGELTILPTFWDIDGELNSTTIRRSFSLNMGQTTTIAIESEMGYIGTLPIGGTEFVHLTIDSLQDNVDWEVLILDSENNFIAYGGGEDGDITVTPFKPGVGTHYIWIGAEFGYTGPVMFNIHPQAITPQTIPAGSIIQDTLTASEASVEGGSIGHIEKAPTVRTYKYSSPEDLARVAFSFNYPELLSPMVPPYPVVLTMTSDTFMWGEGRMRMWVNLPYPLSDSFYYKSIQGETYYLTVQGGDNVQYAIYNSIVEDDILPLNQEFLIQNLDGDNARRGYHLVIEEDSFMKVNATEYSGNSIWYAYSVTEDMTFRQFNINYNTNYQNAPLIYMPAGEYVIYNYMEGNYLAEFEFNIGPITDDLTASIVNVGGFRVPSNALDLYNFSIELLNEDNVTVNTHIRFFDRTGRTLLSTSYSLANWWDGNDIIEHPSQENTYSLPITSTTSDDYTLIGISVQWARNNTGVSPSDWYERYNTSYAITWDEEYNEEFFTEIASFNVEDGGSYRWDLEELGEITELLRLELNLTAGVWYNVSIISEDVTDFSATLLHNIGGRAHITSWTDLDDNEIGDITTELSFQFGAMTQNPVFFITIVRSLSGEGNVTIRFEPFVTNTLSALPELIPTSDMFAGLIAAAPYIAVGGIIVVVVVVVYVKKFK